MHHIARKIRWNGETNSLVPACAGENRGVDTYEPAFGIDERAAGVAHVNCCVGLDEIFVIDNAHAAAAHSADDPHCGGLPQSERITEGEHDIARMRLVAVCKCDRGQIFFVDLQQCHVGARISAHFLRLIFAEFRAKAHHDFLRARHDVISGENVAIRADNDARAKALYCLFTLCSRKLSAEKFAQGFIRKRKPQTWAGDSLSGKDGHHSRRDLFYDRRKAGDRSLQRMRRLLPGSGKVTRTNEQGD